MSRNSDVAFTAAVKARQDLHGSRQMAEARDFRDLISQDLAEFLAQCNSLYLATVSDAGRPYIQHRGGPRGFVQVLDDRTLGFADLTGNRQYITTGNLDGNSHVHLFLMDYANKTRIKIWGSATIADDPDTLHRFTPDGAKADRAFLISVDAWDLNCPKHIPDLYSDDVIRAVTAKLTQRIAQLEAENAELKRWMKRG